MCVSDAIREVIHKRLPGRGVQTVANISSGSIPVASAMMFA
jgi:hypothetical protein